MRLFILLLCTLCVLPTVASGQMPSPYCPVPVFQVPNHPLGGQATIAANGQPVILVDPNLQFKIPAAYSSGFMRFLLAHECAHHMRGHLQALSQAGMAGAYVMFSVSHSAELDADCVATKIMRSNGDLVAIQAAIWVFQNSNPYPTNTHPSGLMRAQQIQQCMHTP